VHELRFFTPDPLDHCARMLDVVRRMGFGLISVRATPIRSDSFDVRMSFMPVGDLSPDVLANRVSGFVGVAGVELTALSEAAAA
jgi:acetolactate synthase regulatory subunit